MPAKKKATAKKKVAKKVAKKSVAKKKVSKKTPAKKKTSKKKVAKKVAKKSVAKKKVSKKTPAKKKTSKKKVAKKVAKKSVAKKKVSKKTPAKKKTSKKKAAKKVAKKSVAKKKVSKKTPAKKKKTTGKLKRKITPYKQRRKNEDYMGKEQTEYFRKILLAWKTELMQEVDRTVHHMQDDATNFPDPNDRASQEEEFALELRTRDRERKLISKIEESISMLDSDEYGFCEICGIEIGIRRLEARPTASQCIDCKTLDEIKERHLG